MFDFIFGLPMHALVIHAVVVFVPLSTLCTIAYVARPSWRSVLRWPTAVGALISGGSAFVAAESGERLLVRVSTTRASTTNLDLLSNHTAWGDRARTVCLVFMVLALVAVYLMPPPAEPEPSLSSVSSGATSAGATSASATSSTATRSGETHSGRPGERAGNPRWRTLAQAPAVQTTAAQATLGAVVVVVSLAALTVVVLTGDAGARAVWSGLG